MFLAGLPHRPIFQTIGEFSEAVLLVRLSDTESSAEGQTAVTDLDWSASTPCRLTVRLLLDSNGRVSCATGLSDGLIR